MTMVDCPSDQPPRGEWAVSGCTSVGPATTARSGQPEASAAGLVITPKHAAETVVLALAGDLDIASAPLLERHLDDAATAGNARVVVDLSDVEFLDSTGLRLLLTARERLQERGQELRLRRGRPAVRRLFESTHTAELFRFED